MDAQRRRALSSLVAAVVTTQAAAQPPGGPGHAVDTTGSSANFSAMKRSGTAMADDGVRLYYEETGAGVPVIFVHEFAGDRRSWEAQVRSLSRWFRCITFNARGYPPSDVPDDEGHYSQARARDDIRDVLTHLRIERAHVIGLSMGGFATLHFGLMYPARAKSPR